jgi:formamidopyrimidine-DNA glycosylase
MPERPDLEYVVPILDRETRGLTINAVAVRKPVVLRVTVPGTPDELLIGQRIESVTRRAHFVLFTLAGKPPLEIAINPMLAGRFALDPARSRTRADVAVALSLSDGRVLRYRDDVQMGKFYLLAKGAWSKAPGLEKIGVDVLDDGAFPLEKLRELARQRRDQVKVFLMDKSAIDAFGNAYADEVLWEARIHPKTMARRLTEDELGRLHVAIVGVLRNASDTIRQRQPALDEKLRDFLNVRGHAGEPCPRCGAKLRRARVRADDSIFCPQCQPDARGTSIVDWRKLGGDSG